MVEDLNKNVSWALIIILIVVGLYLAVAHAFHEQIGLGTNHTVHTIVGIILIILALVVWYLGNKKKK